MTLAEKLRFLANRAEDGKPFLIDDGNYVFDKNTLRIEGGSSIFAINDIKFADLKLKPTWEFTEEEKTILRNASQDYNWIAIDRNGDLYLYETKPKKHNGYWVTRSDCVYFNVFKHLFQSVQWSDDEPCEFRRYI